MIEQKISESDLLTEWTDLILFLQNRRDYSEFQANLTEIPLICGVLYQHENQLSRLDQK